MKAIEELQHKANYKFIFEFLQDLEQKSLDKNNIVFANQVQAVKNMVEENWTRSIEELNEVRLLNATITELEIIILKDGLVK